MSKHIHMLGICGTGMASLAGLLLEKGHSVTGSDQDVYPPMSTQLSELGVKIFKGYSAEHIKEAKPDSVVIGNVIRRENPEAVEVLKRGIEYDSMPGILSKEFLKDKKSIVICGTHGKTTTSSLAVWILSDLNLAPGFLIGGVPLNFAHSYSNGNGEHFVIEGDEYDTAFFDKGPKFLHYRPQFVIITSIEFDHADIYKDRGQIEESFKKLISIIPTSGLLVANFDDAVVKRLAANAKCKVVGYSTNEKGDYCSKMQAQDDSGTKFVFRTSNEQVRYTCPLFGNHNLQNTTGVLALLSEMGFKGKKLDDSLKGFKGVARRQQIVGEKNGIVVIDDFAHHPTAIRETILAMRSRFPKRRIWAIFEPRSNTSRRNIFQNEFTDALNFADMVILGPVFKEDAIASNERLDTNSIASNLKELGKDALATRSSDEIVTNVSNLAKKGDVILIMSNGSFDGIHIKILNSLKNR